MEPKTEAIRFYANAKINLTLEVLGLRSDGYHELRTIMHSIALCDAVELRRIRFDGADEENRIIVRSSIPLPFRNTARRAAEAYFSANAAEGYGVQIDILKNIPSEAGLGGASADAAAVLRGMERLFGKLDESLVYQLGKSIGADVPFCLHGGCALCEGIGEKLTPLPCQSFTLLIVRGDRGVSTGALFRSLDEGAYCGTADRSAALAELFNSGLHIDSASAAPYLMNDLEPAAELIAPEIREYRERMLACGANGAVMTGSGACVFGLFSDESAAEAAYDRFSDCAFRAISQTADGPFGPVPPQSSE